MNLKEYKRMLREHDWFYAMSDSIAIYEKGRACETKLKGLAGTKVTYMKAYKVMECKMFHKKSIFS